MGRFEQKAAERGSQRWLQRAVNDRADVLDSLILPALTPARSLNWVSPLRDDAFAEYSDATFLRQIGLKHLITDLASFWPAGGPHWDALATTDLGDVLLVEAKAHIPEMFSDCAAKDTRSRDLISAALKKVAGAQRAAPVVAWDKAFYQFANRLAHLWFLREHQVAAWLVLVNFVGDAEMGGPATAGEWNAARLVANHLMGLPVSYPLSRFVVSVHPDVAEFR